MASLILIAAKSADIEITEISRTPTESVHRVCVRTQEVPHYHASHDSVVTLTRGGGVLYLAGTAHPLKAGDRIAIPRRVVHYFVHQSTEPFSEALVVFTPPYDGKDRIPVSGIEAQVFLRVETPSNTRTVSRTDLESQLTPQEVTVSNPEDQRTRSYRGFWLEDILKTIRLPPGEPYFVSSDGYTSSLSRDRIGHHRWLLAYGESSGGWTPMMHKGEPVIPAPWYLVGVTPDSYQEFPWPYQVTTIRTFANW